MKKLKIFLVVSAVLLVPSGVAYAAEHSHWKDNQDYYVDKYQDGSINCYVARSHDNGTWKDPSISCARNK